MSFIVKGVDLPEEGQQLRIIVTHNGQVIIDKRTYTEEAEAIQIPKDHGRLKDTDKIDYDEFWHREGQGFTIAVCQKAQQIIEEQPTILEEEE